MSSKTDSGGNRWRIWTQRVPKEAQMLELRVFVRFLSKIFRLKRMVGRQKNFHYIRIEYFGFIDVLSSVHRNKHTLSFFLCCLGKIESERPLPRKNTSLSQSSLRNSQTLKDSLMNYIVVQYMNGRLSKTRSLHTYGIVRTPSTRIV